MLVHFYFQIQFPEINTQNKTNKWFKKCLLNKMYFLLKYFRWKAYVESININYKQSLFL